MRVNLNVPFPRKDEAKAHGAKWDAQRKVWYFFSDDLSPYQIGELAKFIPSKTLKAQGKREAKAAIRKAQATLPRQTLAVNSTLPACSCASPPWEDCFHTTGELDPDALAHLRAIQAGA